MKKPFSYQQFHLRELRNIRGRRSNVSFDTNSPCCPYVTALKARQFNKNFPALPIEDFQNHSILVFNLTSLQDAAEQLHYPDFCGESLNLEMFFQFPLDQVTEVIVLGERLSNIQIEQLRTVAKKVELFRVFRFLLKFCNFLGRFFVMVSVLSTLFFFRPKSPEKADNQCC